MVDTEKDYLLAVVSDELSEPEDLANEAAEHLQNALDELNDLILELESSNNKDK